MNPEKGNVPESIRRTRKLTALARDINSNHCSIIVFSGAGLSAESGIPTFRDPKIGVWRNKIGLALFGTPFGWKWTPQFAWRAYMGFRSPIVAASPNPAHHCISKLQKLVTEQDPRRHFTVITQNVDNLHQEAGSTNVLELHGSVYRHKCIKRGHLFPDDTIIGENAPASLCPQCRSRPRPDCVLFTEPLDDRIWKRAMNAINELRPGDVVFVCGTSAVVAPACHLIEYAFRRGATLVEINTDDTETSGMCHYVFRRPAGEFFPDLMEEYDRVRASVGEEESADDGENRYNTL